MASNFKIAIHRNDDNLHLKLMGDFDGSSACELINTLKNKCKNIGRIFIHTNGLDHIHPFGQRVFHHNFNMLKVRTIRIFFTGDKAKKIAPEERYLMENQNQNYAYGF